MAIERVSRKDISKMSTKEFMKVAWLPYRKLFAFLKPYKFRFGLGILFGALFGATNALLIFAIKHVSTMAFPDGQPSQAQAMLGKVASESTIELSAVALTFALVPLIMLLRGACSYLNSYYMLWVSLHVLEDIRTDLFSHIMAQSMEFFNRSKSGDLIQTVFNQTRMAQQALTTVSSDVIKQPISIIGALGALLMIDWKFTLIALVLFPICIIPVVVVGKKVRKSGGREEEEAAAMMVVMHEAFAGIRVVKAYSREDHEKQRFDEAGRQMLRHVMRWRKAMELVGPLVETFASVGIGLALLYAWHFKLGVGTFWALQGGLVLLYPPIKTLSRIHIMMQKCLSATTKVFEVMDRPEDIQDVADAVTIQGCKGELTFEDVTFSYGAGTPAVADLDLNIASGKSYALVGASGAGKSTILSLILRFYDPQQGSILLDGRDIRSITQASLRNQISVVNQDTFLFHDSILTNIRYGRLDATREEVEAAAKRAFAHDFILQQPSGYETVIGDKGCMLSGGQQQRISIARAILRNSPILLLDEATSALDSESEQKIQQALETLSEGRTVIAIAHRLSTVLKADQIVVMEGGRVLDVGRHDELLDRSPVYRRLYELQFQGGRELAAAAS